MNPIETFQEALSVRTIVAKYKAAAEGLSHDEFIEKVKAIDVSPAVITVPLDRLSPKGKSTSVYVNFYNLPKGHSLGGADAENNRVAFSIEGFNPEGQDKPTNGKVKLELRVFALRDKQYKPRGKSGSPQDIVNYIEKTLKKIVAEVEPKLPPK